MKWRLNELMGEYQTATGNKITQREIAQATGLSTTTLSMISQNKTERADLDTLNTLIRYFARTLNRPVNTSDILQFRENGSS